MSDKSLPQKVQSMCDAIITDEEGQNPMLVKVCADEAAAVAFVKEQPHYPGENQ